MSSAMNRFECDGGAVRTGVLVNAARGEAAVSAFASAARGLVGSARAICTASPGEVPAAVERLVVDEGVTVMAVHGGDGSIHHAVNALARFGADSDRDDALAAVPVLALGGGTMNIVARALGSSGAPAARLDRFVRTFEGRPIAGLPSKSVDLLEIDASPVGRCVGFVFGTALTARCLSICDERFGGSRFAFLRLIGEALAGPAFGTRFWREHKALLDSCLADIRIDGRIVRCLAAVASTVDITLAGGLIRGFCADPTGKGFAVRTLAGLSPRTMWSAIPRLVAGRTGAGIEDHAGCRKLEASGAFSVDGEVREAASAEVSVVVGLSERAVRFVLDEEHPGDRTRRTVDRRSKHGLVMRTKGPSDS